MTIDKNRENASEKKFELDQQLMFKVEARASKLIGVWAAEKMGLTGAEADSYAKDVVMANLDEPGFDDVKRKLVSDFSSHDLEVSEHEIDHAFVKYVALATDQIKKEAETI